MAEFLAVSVGKLIQREQGVFGGIVGNADWLETFGHPGTGLEGIIVSIYNLGAYVLRRWNRLMPLTSADRSTSIYKLLGMYPRLLVR